MTADTVGGVWTYALELAARLAAQVSRWRWRRWARRSGRAARGRRGIPGLERVRERRFKLEWMDDPWDDVARAGDWLLELESAFAPDVVHLNGYGHGALPWRAPIVVVGHSCVLSWWQRGARRAARRPSGTAIATAVAAGCVRRDVVVAPSRAMLHASSATTVAAMPTA